MREKYKPAVAGALFCAVLLLPLVASLMAARETPTGSEIGGGTICAAGTSSYFYPANGTATGGLAISCNNTNVDRLSRNVGFTVNATTMLQPGGWDTGTWGTSIYQCDLNITFPNGTSSFRLRQSVVAQVFTLTWRTNTTIPTGNYTVRANIWNQTKEYTGGFDFTPLTTVTVFNVAPVGSVVLLNATDSKIYRNQVMEFMFSIFDPETPFPELGWNVSLYKFANATLVEDLPEKIWFKNDTLNQTYNFTGADAAGDYIFLVNITDGSGGFSVQTVSPFTVLNNPPVIHSVSYNHTSNLKRYTETMQFEVNVTDPDNEVNATTHVVAILQHEWTPDYPSPVNETSSVPFEYDPATGNFTGNLTVTKTFPTGDARIIIKAIDNDAVPAVGYFYPLENTTYVTNNDPVLNGVTVNGLSLAAGLRFPIYENLDFSVNASDVEETIYSVQVSLIGPNGENVTYFILGPPPFEVRITTAALATGSWGVFVTVVDIDGGVSANQNAGIIEIDPDLREPTAYIIGGVLLVIAGFVIGGMVIWRYANARISAIRRDMVIKAQSREGQEARKGKPGEKGASSRYVEPPVEKAPEPEPGPKQPSKPAEKAAAGKPFTGAQAPPSKGKQAAPEKKQGGSKPR